MPNSIIQKSSLSILFLAIWSLAFADVQLPKLVSDGMVLQRDAMVKIWGWADEGEAVTVHFLDQKYTTTTDENKTWSIELNALSVGGPHQMLIEGNNKITIDDILIGDVWICSGQSNMELPMRRVKPLYDKELANDNNPKIRQFYVPRRYDFNVKQQDVESGQWQAATHENLPHFSATAYFFAKELYAKYQVPIGLINSALGGSPAEAWISLEVLKPFETAYKEAKRFQDQTLIEKIKAEDQARSQQWYTESTAKDRGRQTPNAHWDAFDLKTDDWEHMNVPGYWADTELGEQNGVVWFRKEIELPASAENQAAKLELGRVVDADSTFVNGVFVGNITYQYPLRWYQIPEGILKAGKNVITVRVTNTSGRGGFIMDKKYEIKLGDETIDLKGEWKYKLGAAMPSLQRQTFIRWKPSGLYNGMISPLLNYSMKGVIWYQGESNAGRPDNYAQLMETLI
ncbi:MAG: sialate O-acetylesterase, partial [Bacteroidota bacterium]